VNEPKRARKLVSRLAAELGVIVLGVWIALWADGWAAERNDREIETARLRALAENIDQTLAELHRQRADAEEAATALRQLVTLSASRLDPEEIRSALLSGFFFVPTFSPELNVYEDLKNSGELALLTDTALRQALSSMDATLEEIYMALHDMEAVQQLNYDPYLLSRIDLRPILGPYLHLPESSQASQLELDFVVETEFRNLALFKLDLTVQVQEALDRAGRDLSRVARLIAEQLQLPVPDSIQ
jgi:hypothetical protein